MIKDNVDPFSIAILAGGQSRRMGQNKALLEINNKPVLQYVIEAVAPLTNNLFLVTNTPQVYQQFNLSMIGDVIPHKAALGGIYTAITQAKYEWTLVLACDMPLLNPDVILFLARQRLEFDVVIPQINQHPETLHAFYKKTCLPFIKQHLQRDELKVSTFFKSVKVHYIFPQMLTSVTENFKFLTNINTPAEFTNLKNKLENKKSIK